MRKRTQFVGFNHVQLAAPSGSENEAREFFGEILGLQEIPKPSNLLDRGGVWFRVGSQELHIGMEDPKSFHPNKKAHPAFEVRNLKELCKLLVSKRIAVRDEEPLECSDRFYTEDPFGNRLEFLQRKVE